MASVYIRNNILYITWYNAQTGKNESRTTKLENNKENKVKAKKMADRIQFKLDEKNSAFYGRGFQRVSIQTVFEDFLRRNSGKNHKTIRNYKRFFELFSKRFELHLPVSTITKNAVEDWIIELKATPYKINTIHTYVTHCVHFLNFLFEYNYIPMFKINKDVRTKPEVGEVIVFGSDDVRKIIEGLKNKSSNFRLMILLLYYTGLRPSDILSITKDKLSLADKTFSFYSPKVNRYFTQPFHENLLHALTKRCDEISEGKIIEYGSIDHMTRAFSRYLKELGLSNKGYSLRTFRKSFVTLASETTDLETVSKLVGHKNITTTVKYYTCINDKRKADGLAKVKFINESQESPEKV